MPWWGWNEEVTAQGYRAGEVTFPGWDDIRSVHVVGGHCHGLVVTEKRWRLLSFSPGSCQEEEWGMVGLDLDPSLE